MMNPNVHGAAEVQTKAAFLNIPVACLFNTILYANI